MSPRLIAFTFVMSVLAARAAAQCDAPTAPVAEIVISEIQPRGDVHWIELWNSGDTDACLDGFAIEIRNVKGNTVLRRRDGEFEAGAIIPAGGYRLKCLFVDPAGVPQGAPAQCLDCLETSTCTLSDLDKDGGTVTLWWTPPCDPTLATRADVVRYPPLDEESSFGLAGEELCILATPTPGAPNGTCEPRLSRVILNEIATNQTNFVHLSLRPDWIELHCPGPEAVDLADFVITSEGSTLVFPAGRPELTVMQPGSFLLVACDEDGGAVGCCAGPVSTCCDRLECWELRPGERTCHDGQRFHAPFALGRTGDSVALVAPGGESDRVVVPRLEENEVYARQPDGEWSLSLCPTPDAPNDEGTRQCGAPPQVSFVDRFPLRVEPGDEVEIIVEVSDRDDNLSAVTLHWRFEGGEEQIAAMAPGKRVSCEHVPGEIIYVGRIPGMPSEGLVEIEVEARDFDGHATRSHAHRLRVQSPPETVGLVINEVAAANALVPPDGTDIIPGEWVELYNAGDTVVDLTDLVITDSVFNLEDRRIVPQIPELAPGGYLVLFTSGDVSRSTPREIHLPFRLNRCAEQIVLYDVDGETVIDFLRFHEEKEEATLGRIPDGSMTAIGLTAPSPASPNSALACTTGAELGFPIGDVVINELCADNWTTAHDGRDEFGDWVEIYNRGEEAIALGGWKLRDRAQVERGEAGWDFPAMSLVPGEHLLVWCDNDADCEDGLDGELHTNFEINRLSDYVELVAPDGSVADHVRVEFQYRDLPVGRVPDGAQRLSLVRHTPGGPNGVRVVDTPLFESCLERCPFKRGDSNRNDAIGLSDPVHTLNFLFLGQSRTSCPDSSDANDDGSINLSDAVHTLNFLFLGGAPLPPPFPNAGPDPTPDGIDCTCE